MHIALNSKNDIYGLDLLKFMMALLIVSIHTQAFLSWDLYDYIKVVQKWCVPTFFFLSSFFLMKKFITHPTERKQFYIRFISRMGLLYAFWFIFNIPIYIRLLNCTTVTTFEFLTGLIKNILFSSTFEGSWFLSALFVGMSILCLFVYIGIDKWIILISFSIVYIIVYICKFDPAHDYLNMYRFYNWYTANICKHPLLSFIRSLPFIALGYVMATHTIYEKIQSLANNKLFHSIPIILAILIFTEAQIGNIIIEQFFILLAVPLISTWFHGLRLPESKVWKLLRNLSILIYLLHFMLIVYVRNIPMISNISGISKYILILFVAISISYIIIFLSNNKIRVFRYLY